MTIRSLSQGADDDQSQKPSLCRQCDVAMATHFLSSLSEGEDVTFQTFDDSTRKDRSLARIFHGTLEAHASELISLNQQGAGVFVTINQTDGKGRETANIVKVRAVFVDLDGAPLEPVLKAPVTPHITIESSSGRYHAYWLIEGLRLEEFRPVQLALANRFNTDPKIIDLPRVMRLPGFYHQKSKPFQTKILEASGTLPINSNIFLSSFEIQINPPKMIGNILEQNSVLKALEKSKILLGPSRQAPGRWNIRCPWSHLHTTEGSEAHYFEPHTNGYSGHGFKCFHTHCSNRKGEDLLNWLGKGIKNSVHIDEPWEDPISLPEGLPPVAALDPEMIPEPLREWLLDIAERMQIPPDFSTASAIVVLSSLAGRKIGILPKQKDDWLVVPNLWGAVVGRPSLLKSPAIAQVMKPLDRLIADASQKHDAALANYKLSEMAAKAKKDALQKKLNREAAKNANLDEFLEDLQLDNLKGPTLVRYKTEDGTVAKIGEILLENPNGILIHRDELTGWLKSLDKDGREGDRQFFLESWNGSGSFIVDRIARGTLHIPALCLSILGGVQPGPLSSYIYQALKGGAGDDGLIQRFQLLVWPDAPKAWKNIDRWPDTKAKNRAYDIFDKLSSYSHLLEPDDLDTEIPSVRYSPDGQEVFNHWRANLESRLLTGDLSPAIESHLAKYRSLIPSLSLLFQLCQNLDLNLETHHVGREATEMAVKWSHYLETHAHRLYSSVASAGLESARALLLKLQSGDVKDTFTLRDIYLKHWSKLATTEEVDRAVDILVLHGWLRVVEVKTEGRPKQLIKKHPLLKKTEPS